MIQPYTQKLIDAGILHDDDMYEEIDDNLHVYYIDVEYCVVYEFDDGIGDTYDILIGDIGEQYDDTGEFVNYNLLLNHVDDVLTVDELDGHLKVYKRITQ